MSWWIFRWVSLGARWRRRSARWRSSPQKSTGRTASNLWGVVRPIRRLGNFAPSPVGSVPCMPPCITSFPSMVSRRSSVSSTLPMPRTSCIRASCRPRRAMCCARRAPMSRRSLWPASNCRCMGTPLRRMPAATRRWGCSRTPRTAPGNRWSRRSMWIRGRTRGAITRTAPPTSTIPRGRRLPRCRRR